MLDHKSEETKTGSKPGSLQPRFSAPQNLGGVRPSMEDIKEQDSEQEHGYNSGSKKTAVANAEPVNSQNIGRKISEA